jgi:threonine/homoserine efflux transporter RhtA
MPAPSRSLLPLLALVGVAFSLGAGHVCARFAFTHGVGILTAATLRSVCATLILFALLRVRGIPVLPNAAGAMQVLGAVVVVAAVIYFQVAARRK